jgi:iron complex outermembrane recepter protein
MGIKAEARIGSMACWLATTSLLSLAAPVAAQEVAPAAASTAEASAVPDIVVTGSRIRRANEVQSTPVATLGAAELASRGTVNIVEALSALPAVGANTLSPSGAPRNTLLAGLYTVDLRSLGSSRTLVLVDGKRYVSGLQGSSAVDISTIPTDLIDRVEVTTGGASAVYGSDAIAGVVNFVLKKKVDGLQLRAQSGISSRGDAGQYKVGLVGGGSFADDRGSFVAYANYDKTKPVYAADRSISRNGVSIADPTRPDLALIGPSSYTSLRTTQGVFGLNGATISGATVRRTVLADGSITTPLGSRDGDNPNEYNIIYSPSERYMFGARFNYELSDAINFTMDGSYAHNETLQRFEPTFLNSGSSNIGGPTGLSNTIPVNNPFIPAAMRALIPAGRTDISFARDFTEFGPRDLHYTRELYRFVGGLDGKFEVMGRNWSWDAYYEYGRTTLDETMLNGIDTQRFYQSQRVESNGAGGYRCVDAAARAQGCIPVNLFTGQRLTAAEMGWLGASATIDSSNTQQVAAASVTGDLFNISRSPVAFAAGVEWRKESSNYVPSEALRNGLISLQFAGITKGDFTVKEAYAELTVPLLEGLPFVDYLEVEGAYRYAKYSISGGASSWKIGGTYRPIQGLRFRGIYAKAVRAPNINDLFRGATGNLANVSDPCRGGGTTAARQTYCLAQPGITAGFAPPATTQVQQSVVGNPNLTPEIAHTLTVGGVLTPGFARGLSLSVDYFRIKIDDAITSLAAQTVVDQCANTNDPVYCSTVIRDPSTGIILRNNSIPINAAQELLKGIDVELAYRTRIDAVPGIGRLGDTLSFQLNYTRTIAYDTAPFAGAPSIELRGQPFYPANKGNLQLTYTNGPLTASLNERYIGKVYRVVGGSFEGNTVPAYWYTDLQLRYDITEKYAFYAGMNNVTDKKPPFFPVPYVGTSTGTNTAASVYDLRGRFMYAGVNVKF